MIYARSAIVKQVDSDKLEEISNTDDEQDMLRGRRRITKLNNENFNVWQIKMELVLDDLGLWNSKSNKPKGNRQAWKEIMYAIEDNQFVHIENLKDGETAWEALSKHHERSGMTNKINTLRNFFNSRFDRGTMDEHCAKLVTTQRKLKRLGLNIEDDIVIAILLNSLPSQYDSLVYAWDAVGGNLSLEDVIAKLKNLKISSVQEGAIALNVVMNKVKCFNCGKFGHFKRNCTELNEKNKDELKKPSDKQVDLDKGSSANKLTEEKHFSLQVSNSNLGKDDWLLDSGSNYILRM